MSVLDQLQVLNDSDPLSAGNMIEFALGASCWPFFTPTYNQVQAAFQQYAPSVTLSGEASNWAKWFTMGWRDAFYAQVTGATTAGTVRGQIINAMNGINSQLMLSCSDWTIDGGTIYLVLQQGTGDIFSGLKQTTENLGGTISLLAIAAIAFFAWRTFGK